MNYKFILFFFLISLSACVNQPFKKEIKSETTKNFFLNKGFALVYNDDLYNKKKVKGKIEKRSLIIFQKNLNENSTVRITNLINSKYIIVKVGKKFEYPFFLQFSDFRTYQRRIRN